MKYNPRSLTGKKVGDKVIVHEGAPGGMRKIRCPTSHTIATPIRREKDGTEVVRTPNGVQYKVRPLK